MAAVAAVVPFVEQSALIQGGIDRAEAFARASKAVNTLKGYSSDWRSFESWCTARGFSSLPAEPKVVALYAADLAQNHKAATVTRHMAAISSVHKGRGYESPSSMRHPCVQAVMAGIKRVKGTSQTQKSPLLVPELRRISESLPEGKLISLRDRALLLIGFTGAFRRSELVGLNVEDCAFSKEGIKVTLRRSKTDQEGKSRDVGILYGSNPDTCAVRCLQNWLDASGATTGPLFRSINRHGQLRSRLHPASVGLIVKRNIAGLGLDAAKYAGHSLRSGLATSAAMAGASERSIMNQTGHRSVQMVRKYIRNVSLFRDNCSALLGL